MAGKKQLTGKDLQKLEDDLFKYEGDDRIVSSHDLAKTLKETDDSIFRIETGFPSLDRYLDKVEAGELILVTGPTGEGKTTLLTSITKNMAKDKIDTLWFTMEVTPRQFIHKIKGGNDIDDLPLFYVPRENLDNNIDWVEKRIIEAKVKFNIKVVFIDHIHQIFSLEKFKQQNLSLEMGDMTAKIKAIALEHGLIIFLIAHNRDDSNSPTREPKKEDVRDSGLIIRYADTVIGIWRVPNSDELKASRRKEINETDIKAKVRVFKNRRNGIQGAFFVYHDNHIFSETDPIDATF